MPDSASIASSNSGLPAGFVSPPAGRLCSRTLAAMSSNWKPAVPRLAYFEDTTSPCSVRRRRPRTESGGCAAIARPAGAPPRLTDPPRPWKKAIGMPVVSQRRVSFTCALLSSQLAQRKPPSLLESE